MAIVKNKKTLKKQAPKYKSRDILKIDLNPLNYLIIGIGLVLIIIGYIMLSQNSVNGFVPTVMAPIVLVIGYCIVIPIGILYPTVKKEIIEDSSDKNKTQAI